EDQRSGGLKSGFGLRIRHLGGRVARDRFGRQGAQADSGQGREFVQRAPSDTQRKTSKCRADQGKEWQAPQWAVLARQREKRADGVLLRDDYVSHLNIVAARTAQTDDVPVIEDL